MIYAENIPKSFYILIFNLFSMKKLILIGLIIILIAACKQQPITNFKECVAAGNPVLESYPRQCRANDQTFVEVIEEPIEDEKPIGGERDEHGCLGPAGYQWCPLPEP